MAITKEQMLQALRKQAPAPGTGRLKRSTPAEPGVVPVEGRFKLKFVANETGMLPDPVTGELKYFEAGQETVHEDDHNLVVTQAETIMAKMAGGVADSPIDYIELGEGITPPALIDTALETPFGVPQQMVTVNTQNANTAIFTATWGVGDGNGKTFTEAGLFTGPFGTGSMFARKVFSALVKGAGFSFVVEWFITFSVSSNIGNSCTGVALVGNSLTVEEFNFTAAGGETDLAVPIDFSVGAKRLEVFLNGLRLVYGMNPGYHEGAVGPDKGIIFDGFPLVLNDIVFVRHLRFA